MILPIYDEIKFTGKMSYEDIKKILSNANVSSLPIYFDATLLPEVAVHDVLTRINDALKELDLNTKFPYPFYIVYKGLEKQFDYNLNVVESVKELPQFYFKRMRHPGNKELSILIKCKMFAEKLQSVEIDERIKLFNDKFAEQDEIFDTCSQIDHIETILAEIRKAERKENER